MKKLLLFAAAAIFLCTGCATTAQKAAPAKPYTGKQLRAGFYIDKGSRGGGVLNLARLLHYSPQIKEVVYLKGEDLVKGKLKGLDMLVMPGGSSQLQMTSMTPAGVKALQDYVRNGGIYVGICAGFHITLNRPERAQLMPYTYIKEAVGNRGDALIEFTPEARKLLNIDTTKIFVRYSRGPIARKAQWNKGTCKTYAVYKSSVSPLNRLGKSFYGTPALIGGTYGKGKLIASSFHPEGKTATYHIFSGMVYAVTGVKLTPKIPRPVYRSLRTVYPTIQAMSKGTEAAAKEFIALEKNTDLQLLSGLNPDNLALADVVVLPEIASESAKKFAKGEWPGLLKSFMDSGRKVVTVGPGWKAIPNHKNLTRIAAKDELDKAVLKAAAK